MIVFRALYWRMSKRVNETWRNGNSTSMRSLQEDIVCQSLLIHSILIVLYPFFSLQIGVGVGSGLTVRVSWVWRRVDMGPVFSLHIPPKTTTQWWTLLKCQFSSLPLSLHHRFSIRYRSAKQQRLWSRSCLALLYICSTGQCHLHSAM